MSIEEKAKPALNSAIHFFLNSIGMMHSYFKIDHVESTETSYMYHVSVTIDNNYQIRAMIFADSTNFAAIGHVFLEADSMYGLCRMYVDECFKQHGKEFPHMIGV